jgi:hypothetical protein
MDVEPAKSRRTWLDVLSDAQREWPSISRSLSAAATALADLPRQLAQAAGMMLRLLESPQVQQLLEEISRPGWWDRVANAYCDAYQLEIAELGLGPLSKEEQLSFMVFGSMLAGPGELGLGRRPALLQVAVAGQRPDLALAVLLRQGLDRSALRSLSVADSETREELVGQATLALGEEILPGLERRVNGLGLGGMARLKPLLAEVTKDACLVVAIRRELIRYLGKEELHREREEAQEPAVLEDELLCAPEQERRLNHRAVEQAIGRFLKRPRAKQIDARIVAAIGQNLERTSASIARELGVPETTVRYRRRLLMEFLSKDLGN